MATKEIYLEGMVKWTKGLKTMDEKFKSYSCQFYPTDKSMNQYKQLGLKTKYRMDDDGESLSLRRPHSRIFGDELKVFGPPEVFDKDNTPVDPTTVGNGSKVTVKLSVYDTGYGKGSRLEAVRIDELKVFVPEARDPDAKQEFKPPFDA